MYWNWIWFGFQFVFSMNQECSFLLLLFLFSFFLPLKHWIMYFTRIIDQNKTHFLNFGWKKYQTDYIENKTDIWKGLSFMLKTKQNKTKNLKPNTVAFYLRFKITCFMFVYITVAKRCHKILLNNKKTKSNFCTHYNDIHVNVMTRWHYDEHVMIG